jgi:hypothetical protein
MGSFHYECLLPQHIQDFFIAYTQIYVGINNNEKSTFSSFLHNKLLNQNTKTVSFNLPVYCHIILSLNLFVSHIFVVQMKLVEQLVIII